MRRVLMALAVGALACVCLAGCEHYEPTATKAQAQAYYQQKYGCSEKVADSHNLGNYALFGYSFGGTEFVMTDGSSVIYVDSEGVYRDNRQTAEIDADATAFALEMLGQIPGSLSAPQLREVGDRPSYETLEGEGHFYHERYEGDVEDFCLRVHPWLSLRGTYPGDGAASYDAAYDEAYVSEVEEGFGRLGRYFRMHASIIVADPAAFASGQLSEYDEGLRYTLVVRSDEDGVELLHKKPAFVEAAEGIFVSSDTAGVDLEEGDVTFEDVGGGFYECHVSEDIDLAETRFVIRNESGGDLLHEGRRDNWGVVCPSGEMRDWRNLYRGQYYLGSIDDVQPWVEVERIDADGMVFSYHTRLKDEAGDVGFTAIGLSRVDDRGGHWHYATTGYEYLYLGETTDGWRYEVLFDERTKRPDNEIALQFTYAGDGNVTVQIKQEVTIPEGVALGGKASDEGKGARPSALT